MSFELGELKVEDGKCWRLMHIETRKDEIRLGWRENVKEFLESQIIKVEGDWKKASELFKPDEYPLSVQDRIETFRKEEVK